MSNDFHSLNSDNTIHEDYELRPLTQGMKLCTGKYRLELKAGNGGMGVVWKAWDTIGERWVALKFISSDIRHSEAAMGQVKTAFLTIQELLHPNICPIYGLENDSNFGYFVVMKWLEGHTLSEVQLPKEKIPYVLEKVADALDHAHEKKVIHRDVKPSNILISDDGGVYLIDFGLARQIRTETQATQGQFSTSGTAKYMAPEQRTGKYQSAQTDEYSLALVALELLTGSLSPMAATKLSPSIQEVLGKALSDEPKNRFATCREFVDTLMGTEKSDAPAAQSQSAIDMLVKSERKTEGGQSKAEDVRRADPEWLRKQILTLDNTIAKEYQAGHYHEVLRHIEELQKLKPDHANAQWLKDMCEKKLGIRKSKKSSFRSRRRRRFSLWPHLLWIVPVLAAAFFLLRSPFVIEDTKLVKYRGFATKTAIPAGVTMIGDHAFGGRNLLKSVVIPEGVTEIGVYAFEGCSGLTSLEIPSSVKVIERRAFSDCTALRSIDLPEGVTEIGTSAFYHCSSLTSVNIPETVSEIQGGAFANCPALERWSISPTHPYFKSDGTGLLTKDGKTIVACLGTAKEYWIPSGVVEIGNGAFEGCRSLTSVTIPGGVMEIGSYAFSECNSLMSVVIPRSVMEISPYAFEGCPLLTIHAPKGSKAEEYAKENNIPFVGTN